MSQSPSATVAKRFCVAGLEIDRIGEPVYFLSESTRIER
jgi:hypothetical protein